MYIARFDSRASLGGRRKLLDGEALAEGSQVVLKSSDLGTEAMRSIYLAFDRRASGRASWRRLFFPLWVMLKYQKTLLIGTIISNAHGLVLWDSCSVDFSPSRFSTTTEPLILYNPLLHLT